MHRLPRDIANCKVLFVALNWGSGHVFRSIPILQDLQNKGCELLILETPDQALIYQHYLQNYLSVSWKGYRFRFSGKGRFSYDLAKTALQLRKDYRQIRREVSRLCDEHQVDMVLSDHVYGANSLEVESIFLTHQVHLPLPKLNPFHLLHNQFMREFSEVWIVDDAEIQLAGKLSRPTEEHRTYIGLPSRFVGAQETEKKHRTILLSGPEPYRSQFLDEIHHSLEKDVEYHVIGLEEDSDFFKAIAASNFAQIDEVLKGSSEIWTRGGYTTLLDNHYLGAKLHLFPTPGQAEQQYLKNRS
ncbi:MAG: hypothetical protein N4A41_08565 [Crocinitomicaceae bacterium]|jgi:hypothetical protein|nr:hypothetical protein [Crocinitomicaceae bacterium]